MLSLALAIAIVAIVIVCIGFLSALILFGVRRYMQPNSDAKHQKGAKQNVELGASNPTDDKQEMEWDNSALNIIVNPLDDFDDDPLTLSDDKDAEAESDDCSACGCSDDEKEPPRCKELEWDDSTLTF